MEGHLPQAQISPFDPDGDLSSQSTRWKKWVSRLDTFFIAHGIESSERKKAVLLLYAGEAVNDIYDAIPQVEKNPEEGEDVYVKAKAVLSAKFTINVNTDFEINKFRNCKQKPMQTLDQYYSELCKLASTCEFDDRDKEIKAQVIQHCMSGRVRRKALRESMTLKQIIDFARSIDLSEKQASTIENKHSDGINLISQHKSQPRAKHMSHTHQTRHTQRQHAVMCRNCGLEYPHVDRPCPAKGKTCNLCHKENHFAKVCRSSSNKHQSKPRPQHQPHKRSHARGHVNTIETSIDLSSSDEEYVFSVNNKNSTLPQTTIKINNENISAINDTGATINILDRPSYDKINMPLSPSDTTIYTYGSKTPINVLGCFSTEVKSKEHQCVATFHVVNSDSGCLLGHKTATDLQLIQIMNKISISENSQPTPERMASDTLLEQYAHVFDGIGKLKDYKVKLHIDNTVKPVVQKHRRIPFHRRRAVEAQLETLRNSDIIEPAVGPTPWVSPIVTVPKKDPNHIRICVDMRAPNKAIKRERHITPTNDELMNDLNGATVFSKLDLNSGYHQLELDEDSRYITTFSTHIGNFRYKRLMFGISSASELFQNTIKQILADIPGALNISDDILVYGKDQQDHDINLAQTLKRVSENNLTLNKAKCVFNKQRLEYNGNVYSAEGVSPDPKKISAIKDFLRQQMRLKCVAYSVWQHIAADSSKTLRPSVHRCVISPRRQLSSHGQMNMKAQYNKSGKICPTQVPCHTLTQIKLQNLSVMPAQLD